ncbi:MAG TPA: DUF2283 domain-containing protein [Nitrososphaerales archaeon]|nr:DUF2283 domain-containing protein [Nitrososphaerales archaeon]
MLEKVRTRYGLRLPSKVLMADYDAKEGDLYIRFREAKRTEGEPTDDGLVIAHYDLQKRLAAVEVIRLSDL